jgi:hypothetical protein
MALILVLHLSKPAALRLDGTATYMDVSAGRIHVNSSADCGVNLNGTPTVIAQKLTVCGGCCGTINGPVEEGAPIEPDPLAGLPDPTGLALPLGQQGQITGPGTYQPGRYPWGVDMNGGTALLMPGIYSFGNGGGSVGLDLKSDSTLVGTGVMIFMEQAARVNITGSGAGLLLTPPTSGTYDGVILFSHRNNIAKNACNLGGGGTLDVQGTVYVPSGQLDIAGTPGKKIGRIIVNLLNVSGNSGFIITGLGVPPPNPPPPEYVFLVE